MKLTKDEQARLAQVGEVVSALDSWTGLIEYLRKLVENDRQTFVDKIVRPRLNLPPQASDKPDIMIDVVSGEVKKL